jgi:hypothetical protein
MSARVAVHYNNAEVRGQLRMWKQQLARDYAVFEAAFHRFDKDSVSAASPATWSGAAASVVNVRSRKSTAP